MRVSVSSGTVSIYTVPVGREWIRPERGRSPGQIGLASLDIDRNQHTGVVSLIGKDDPLLREDRQEIVAAERSTVQLESQTAQGVLRTVGTVSELAAAAELPVRGDDLLHDDADVGQGKVPEYSPKLA